MSRIYSTGIIAPTGEDVFPSETWWHELASSTDSAINAMSREIAAKTLAGYVPRSEATQYGIPGPPNVLSVGTVQGGATAGASITGTSPSQTLNLMLPVGPRGPEGPGGAFQMRETADKGLFEATDTPYIVDTGEIDITSRLPGVTSGSLWVSRFGPMVTVRFRDLVLTPSGTGSFSTFPDVVPRGFRPPPGYTYGTTPSRSSFVSSGTFRIDSFGALTVYSHAASDTLRGTCTWRTPDTPSGYAELSPEALGWLNRLVLGTPIPEQPSTRKTSVSVADYGAVGDGVADDSNAIRDAVAAANGRTVYLTAGATYRITRELVITGDVDLRCESTKGARICMDGQGFNPLRVSGVSVASRTLTGHVAMYGNGWSVADTSGITAGMLMQVVSSVPWYHEPRGVTRKSETHRVAAVFAGKVWTEDPANDGYSAPGESVELRFSNPAKVTMENLTVAGVRDPEGASARSAIGIRLQRTADAVMRNVNVRDCAGTGISITDSYRPLVEGGDTHSANSVLAGYGVQFYGVSFGIVKGRKFWQCRRAVDISGGEVISRASEIDGCIVTGGGRDATGGWYSTHPASGDHGASQGGFVTHGPADGLTIRNCSLVNVRAPFTFRGRNIRVQDSTVTGPVAESVISLVAGLNVSIENVKHYVEWEDGKSADLGPDSVRYAAGRRPINFVEVQSTFDGINRGTVSITGCSADVRDAFMWANPGALPVDVVAKGNHVRFRQTESVQPAMFAASEQNDRAWSLAGNTFSGPGVLMRNINLV